MIVYIIIFSVISVVIIIIGYILFSKIEKLRAIDLEAMRQHKIQQVKVSIVEERMERKIKEWSAYLKLKLSPFTLKIRNFFSSSYKKIIELQRKHRQRAEKKSILMNKGKEALRQKVNAIIAEAEAFIKEEKLAEAEKKYIEAVSFDNQNIDVYRGLAQLYIRKKDFQHALETLEFVKQINPNDESLWRDMGQLYVELNNYSDAVKCFKRAADISPNNPKNLDVLIETSIINKDRYLAESTLQKLREVNSENQKLDEYQKKIEVM